jgi:hypothetical protein
VTPSTKTAIAIMQEQIQELNAIFNQARQDLNTVAGHERIAKWKAKTGILIAQHVSPEAAKQFTDTQPGPSFTSDLLEELQDVVDLYGNVLIGFTAQLKKRIDNR